eukprot:1034370-Pelagomonas_calceolata.AAC.1
MARGVDALDLAGPGSGDPSPSHPERVHPPAAVAAAGMAADVREGRAGAVVVCWRYWWAARREGGLSPEVGGRGACQHARCRHRCHPPRCSDSAWPAAVQPGVSCVGGCYCCCCRC